VHNAPSADGGRRACCCSVLAGRTPGSAQRDQVVPRTVLRILGDAAGAHPSLRLGYGEVSRRSQLAASALPVFAEYGRRSSTGPELANPGPFHRVIYHSGLAVRAETEYEQPPEWVDEWLTECAGRPELTAIDLKKAETERASSTTGPPSSSASSTYCVPAAASQRGRRSGRGRTEVGPLSLYPDYRRSFMCYPFQPHASRRSPCRAGDTDGMAGRAADRRPLHRDDVVLHARRAFERPARRPALARARLNRLVGVASTAQRMTGEAGDDRSPRRARSRCGAGQAMAMLELLAELQGELTLN